MLFFFVSIIWALQTQEFKVIQTLPNNVLVINKGLSDGLSRSQHIKINNADGVFVARAICVFSKVGQSFWMLYRLQNSQINTQIDYKLTPIPLSAPEPLALLQYRQTDWSHLENLTINP